MALSDEHLERHIREFSESYWKGDYAGGGHAGMSLNIYCGLLAEPPERVGKMMLHMKYENGGPYFKPNT
jgi:hypothetical protein